MNAGTSAPHHPPDPHDPQMVERAVHVAANAMFIVLAEGKVCWVNASFSRLFGYEPWEVIGHAPSVLKSGRHSIAFYQELWTSISRGDVWRGTLVNRRKDGSLIEVEQTITPVCHGDGSVSYYFVVCQDPTRPDRRDPNPA